MSSLSRHPITDGTFDLTKISWFTTGYETLMSVTMWHFSDGFAQLMEGKEVYDYDRTIRGALVNLATGGGCVNWYWWLWLDAAIPGATWGAVVGKSMIDTFVYCTVQNALFLYAYGWSKYGHQAGVDNVKENYWRLNMYVWATSLPSDMLTFWLTGWTREVISDISTIICAMLQAYFANRILPQWRRDHPHVVEIVEEADDDNDADADAAVEKSKKDTQQDTTTTTTGQSSKTNKTSGSPASPPPPMGTTTTKTTSYGLLFASRPITFYEETADDENGDEANDNDSVSSVGGSSFDSNSVGSVGDTEEGEGELPSPRRHASSSTTRTMMMAAQDYTCELNVINLLA